MRGTRSATTPPIGGKRSNGTAKDAAISPSEKAALSPDRSVTSHPSAVPAIHVPTLDVINPLQSNTKLRFWSAAKPPRPAGAVAGGGAPVASESRMVEVEATGAELDWAFIVADGTTRQASGVRRQASGVR